MKRRSLLLAAVALPAALPGCAWLASVTAKTITLTETALSDATNALAGVEVFLAAGFGLPGSVIATIATYARSAETTLASIVSAVGSLVPVTSIASLITDLNAAAQAAAPFLGTNPVFSAVEVVLAALAAFAGVAAPAAAALFASQDLPAARAILSTLPRPHLLKAA